MNSIRKTIAGWGRFPRAECELFRPEKQRELQSLTQAGSTLLARGLGRSYGDAALNQSATILQERFNHFLEFDEATGILDCEGGVSLAEIIAVFLPRGWFLPVSPGTKFVTIGGALACDIHGKNHHAVGAFSNFIQAFDLLIANGETLHCSHTENADAFWATVGGMGLTGIITRVKLRLLRVQSAYIKVETERLENLNDTLSSFQSDENYQYSVAWD